ncbi:V-type ATP synthase subunit D [Aerococcus kribbianus]|uniref:V-type ATP synthase subunit D n=1 Tax=Aerococcus kribbianus TaxID=2999064 RepID=A0A9X3FRJ5_9LACT|nr:MULTISPECIES: V-type ATP synthase subunit D [unclassified Aerococcus]MCZ0717032.1 V-type ATP synthase subunit D [Aerococcus sp. YH-aer221]MCZ0725320.1 V-type ATP synthase subunit D [Aerococcus sp. YH-aer222]
MDINSAPTKGNLMQIEKTLDLSKNGYQLMDRKRMILMNELVSLVDQAQKAQEDLETAYQEAYHYLAMATYDNGMLSVHEAAEDIPESNDLEVKVRSIMGSEVPELRYPEQMLLPAYSFFDLSLAMDKARMAFTKVNEKQIKLAQIENAAYRLANNMQKTQKRVNALQNVTIPQLETAQKEISAALEEKEREEFTRLKVVKRILNS